MAQSDEEKSSSILPLVGVGIITIIALSMVLWHFKHDAVCIFFLKIGYYQIYPFAIIPALIGWDSAPPLLLGTSILDAFSNLDKMTPFRLLNLQMKVGFYYACLIIPILLKFSWDDKNHFLNQCNRKYLLWDLLRVQSLTNKCIVPLVRFEEKWLRKRKNRHPNLNRPLLPTEFAKANKGMIARGILNGDLTEKVFLGQISQVLEKTVKDKAGNEKIERFDLRKMPDYWKALAVILATRIVHRGKEGRKKAKALLDEINESTNPAMQKGNDVIPCFNFASAASKFDDFFSPDKINPLIEELLDKSLTTDTLMMHLIFEARGDGKLPTSQIMWLKMIDRTLFLSLNSVTPELIARGWAEAAGTYAQYLSENAAYLYGLKMKVPYVKNAIPAMEKRLYERGVILERKYLSDEDAESLRVSIERKKQFNQQFEDSSEGMQRGRPARKN